MEPRQMLVADIVISEVMYNPEGGDAGREFVELYNAGDTAVNLNNYSLWNLSATGNPPVPTRLFRLTTNYLLQPMAYVAIVDSTNAHTNVPAQLKIGNPTGWEGVGTAQAHPLGNTSDTIQFRDGNNSVVAQLSYQDNFPWPVWTDTWGASLRIVDTTETFNPADASGGRYRSDNWTASYEINGTPGTAPRTAGLGVLINEVLSSSNNAISELDRVELYNSNDTTIDIGGWFLTDRDNATGNTAAGITPRYFFPAGTTIPGKGYLVVSEAQFNAPPVDANDFGLSGTAGDTVALVRPAAGADPALFSDHVAFPPSETSISFARFPSGVGELYPAQAQTFGARNGGHKISDVVVSEIMYNPFSGNDDLEFIELLNRGTTSINLAATTVQNGWRIRRDVDFDFPTGNAALTTIAPNERMLVLRFDPNSAANAARRTLFQNTYGIVLGTGAGQVKAVGGYAGLTDDALSNGDAIVELQERVLAGLNTDVTPPVNVFDFVQRDTVHYFDGNGWPGRPDGDGSSLERIDGTLYADDSESWRSSFEFHGTPGRAPNFAKTIVINEVIAHTDAPLLDAVELFNSTGQPIDISGWQLTDNLDRLYTLNFTIPPGTIIPAGQYITFNQAPSNQNPLPHQFLFGLDAARGDSVWLVQMNGNQRVRFVDNVGFGASLNGVSIGRHNNGTGEITQQRERSLPDPQSVPAPGTVYPSGFNAGPRFDDLIISEVMYNRGGPNSDTLEYVELYNRTGLSIDLGAILDDEISFQQNPWTAGPPQGWRLNGAVRFEFNHAHDIAPFGTMLVVGFDPLLEPTKLALFKTTYGLTNSTVPIVGPYALGGRLSDFGDDLELERPDGAPTTLPHPERFTPNVEVDRIPYLNVAPWPTQADGNGSSLTRIGPGTFGEFPASWTGSAPTPGSTPTFIPPKVTGVTLSSSAWSSGFSSALGGASGYAVPSGANQTLVLPWTGIDKISVTFDEQVTISAGALSVRGVYAPFYATPANASYDPATRTATWTLSQPLDHDRFILDLRADRVRDLDEIGLDGNWTDNTSTYPSGDGVPGPNFLFRFNVLAGDANRNGRVTMQDLVSIRNRSGQSIGSGTYDTALDVNGNGTIDATDLVLARLRFADQLPTTIPNSPPAGDAAASSIVTGISAGSTGSSTTPASAQRVATSRRQPPTPNGALDRALEELTLETPPSTTSRLRATRRPAAPRQQP